MCAVGDVVVLVAVDTAEKKKVQKQTFYFRGWVVVDADKRTVVVVVAIYARRRLSTVQM